MQIKKDTKVKVQYRLELGTGAVLQVAEASGGEYNVDVVFEKNGTGKWHPRGHNKAGNLIQNYELSGTNANRSF